MLVRIAAWFVGLLSLSSMAAAADPGTNDDAFSRWAAIASAAVTSPAMAELGDFRKAWTAPDGRSIQLVVKRPHPRANAPAVRLPSVPEGEDARPYFEAALTQVRRQGAGRLLVPKGTYLFKTAARGGLAHLMLDDLTDVSIEGDGARLVFTQNLPGLYVTHARRLRIAGFTLDYSLHTASLGTVERRDDQNVLVIDPKYAVTAADAVYFVAEYDGTKRLWVPAGVRSIMPPGSATPAVYAGNQTYTSASFKGLKPGRTYMVYHYWYGGQAIRIDDTRGAQQSEDIVIDTITIRSAPGMGIVAYGLKRGLAVVNTTIAPRPDGSSPISTVFDGIHVLLGGGDVLLSGNHISGQGDDGINLNNPVHPIVSIADEGKTLVLSTYSRFIAADDMLAFFSEDGGYLGQARVQGKPKALGGLNNQFTLDRAVPGVQASSVVRDLSLISARFEVSDNTIEACNCHGLLVQWPNGRVQGNTFRDLRANAIRLLTDVGSWKEGVGAFNVVVHGNTISNTGIDNSLPLPWAAISAYGGARGNKVAIVPVNSDLDITDNIITDALQACVTIASTRNAKVTGNVCKSSNLQAPGKESVNVLGSSRVLLSGNKRSGASTGGIKSDVPAYGEAATQTDY